MEIEWDKSLTDETMLDREDGFRKLLTGCDPEYLYGLHLHEVP
jgi:hypothetical protein